MPAIPSASRHRLSNAQYTQQRVLVLQGAMTHLHLDGQLEIMSRQQAADLREALLSQLGPELLWDPNVGHLTRLNALQQPHQPHPPLSFAYAWQDGCKALRRSELTHLLQTHICISLTRLASFYLL